MNIIRCSNCGTDNAFGLSFCTNCGVNIGAAIPPPAFIPSTQIIPPAQKNNKVRNLFIIGGLAAVVLFFIGVFALGTLYLIGRNVQNQQAAAKRSGNQSIDNSSVVNNQDSDYDDTDIEANPFTIPPSVGKFEQVSAMVGHPSNDFPGAEKVVKAIFENKGREVEFLVAEFGASDDSKKGYDDILKGLNKEGAKLIGKQKVKNKAGLTNGEFSVFTYEKKWNALAHGEKYGFRMASADRYALMEFANSLGEMFGDD